VHNFRVKPASPHCFTGLAESLCSGGCRIPNIFRTYNFIQKSKHPQALQLQCLRVFCFKTLYQFAGICKGSPLANQSNFPQTKIFFNVYKDSGGKYARFDSAAASASRP